MKGPSASASASASALALLLLASCGGKLDTETDVKRRFERCAALSSDPTACNESHDCVQVTSEGRRFHQGSGVCRPRCSWPSIGASATSCDPWPCTSGAIWHDPSLPYRTDDIATSICEAPSSRD